MSARAWVFGTMAALALARGAAAGPEHEVHDGHAAPPAGIQALSAPLREALSQEMIALQSGMMTIIPAFASGDWAEVAATARRMEQSYILKQALSAGQLEELHALLPADFLELDAQFHYLAGMLDHAASNRKPELAAFYFSRMLEACAACHSQHAAEKFPR
jgi:hypothetical protein